METLHDILPSDKPWWCFVSLPMAGKSTSEMRSIQESVVQQLEKKYGHRIELIDSVIEEPPLTHNSEVWCLGMSVVLLSDADFVVFVHGWENARGCRIEHEIAKAYGIPLVYTVDKCQEGNTIGRTITKRLKALGMSQAELAKQVGVAPAAISRYCSGERIPNAYILHSLAFALEVPMESLVCDTW